MNPSAMLRTQRASPRHARRWRLSGARCGATLGLIATLQMGGCGQADVSPAAASASAPASAAAVFPAPTPGEKAVAAFQPMSPAGVARTNPAIEIVVMPGSVGTRGFADSMAARSERVGSGGLPGPGATPLPQSAHTVSP